MAAALPLLGPRSGDQGNTGVDHGSDPVLDELLLVLRGKDGIRAEDAVAFVGIVLSVRQGSWINEETIIRRVIALPGRLRGWI